MFQLCLCAYEHGAHVCVRVHKQDKLAFALERLEAQTEEATCFQRQTNEKIHLIKVFKSAFLSV